MTWQLSWVAHLELTSPILLARIFAPRLMILVSSDHVMILIRAVGASASEAW